MHTEARPFLDVDQVLCYGAWRPAAALAERSLVGGEFFSRRKCRRSRCAERRPPGAASPADGWRERRLEIVPASGPQSAGTSFLSAQSSKELPAVASMWAWVSAFSRWCSTVVSSEVSGMSRKGMSPPPAARASSVCVVHAVVSSEVGSGSGWPREGPWWGAALVAMMLGAAGDSVAGGSIFAVGAFCAAFTATGSCLVAKCVHPGRVVTRGT